MRTRFLPALAAALYLTTAGYAQTDAGPALEVRVRSVNDLFAKAEYLGDILNKGEPAKQAAEFVKNLADEKKGIEGIDPTRPFGLYGSVTANVIDSPVVLMVPIADEDAFLDLLRGKLALDPKKGDNGVFELQVPNIPAPVFFRFANKTAYVTVQSAKGIDPKTLIAPKDFFKTDDGAVASARLHLDRLPADVKKVVIGQLELKIADGKQRTDPGETPAQQKLRAWAVERLLEVSSSMLNDGKELTVRLDVEPKTDDLTVAVTMTAKDGSATAKFLRDLGGQTGRAAALAGAKTPVGAVGLRFTLPEKAKAEFGLVVDALLKEQVDKAGPNEQAVAKMAADAVAPTLKAGVLDAGVAVTGTPGKLTPLVAVRVAEGGKIEQFVKTVAAFVPEANAKFTFDAKKAGGLAIHKVVAPNPDLKALFGTETAWFAVSDDLVLLSFEADGKTIAAAAEGKGGKVGVAAADVTVTGAVLATEKGLKPEALKGLVGEVFGAAGAAGKDSVRMSVEGGDALKIRLTLKGKAVKFAVVVDAEKKK